MDWEASARGPAALDHADIAFRVIQDLTYAGISPSSIETASQELSPYVAAALAWRVALWLDRRHATAASALDALLHLMLGQLTASAVTETVRGAKTLGTPY